MANVWTNKMVYMNDEEAAVQSLKDEITELLNSCIECAAAQCNVPSKHWTVYRVEVLDSAVADHRIVKVFVACCGKEHHTSFAAMKKASGTYRWQFSKHSVEQFIEAISDMYEELPELDTDEIHVPILDGEAMLNLYFADSCQDTINHSGELLDYLCDLVSRVAIEVGERLDEPANWCVPCSVLVRKHTLFPEQHLVYFRDKDDMVFGSALCVYLPDTCTWTTISDIKYLANKVVEYVVNNAKLRKLCGDCV